MRLDTLNELLAHLLWPASCPLCGRVGTLGCPACLDALVAGGRGRCLLCGASVPCAGHPGVPPLLAGCVHAGEARDLVHRLKYEGESALGALMGAALARRFPPSASETLLVPIPLRGRSPRGYNQAGLLAGALSRVWGIPTGEALEWSAVGIPQVGRTAAERRALPADALRWTLPKPCGGVVLVDDVVTTGTTLLRSIAAIRLAGGDVAACVVWSVAEGGNDDGRA